MSIIRLSLDRVRPLAAHLERFKRPTVHVAGTNGKGSVTSIIASILQSSGLSVGTFNSPHLVSVLDAILVNGQPVSPSVYDHARSLVIAADQHLNTAATPFELLTLTALQIFEAAKLDIVVVEVGMGGRHDATNVIPDDCILVSVLTSVDLDHQKFLGDTPESIAEHKAGIARSGKPFVLGAQRYPIVEVFARRVVESPEIRGHFIISTPAHPWHLCEEYYFSPSERPFVPPPGQSIEFHSPPFTSPIRAKLPLHGAHQLDNLSLSLTVISTLITHTPAQTTLDNLSHRITAETVRAGIEVGSTLDPSVVLVDGAHNAASAKTLASYISELAAQLKPRSKLHITYIIALSHAPPKTPFDTLYPVFLPHSSEGSVTKVRVAALRFTPPEGMPWVACVPPLEIRDTVRQIIDLRDEDAWIAPNDLPVDCQLQSAFKWTEAGQATHTEENLVVLTGSLYLVADFYRLLKLLGECRWTKPPTQIQIPVADERPQQPLRPHDNPYWSANTLGSRNRRPGNPNVRQTVLAQPADGYNYAANSRAPKRQRLDASISPTVTFNGASSSYARGPVPRSKISEFDIQGIEPPRATNNRSNPLTNDAEIIDLGSSSDDLSERVPRDVKSSSPDPIRLISQKSVHPFETHPAKYNLSGSNKGKGRAKEVPKLVVEGSEEEEEIGDFTPSPRRDRPSNAKESREIPPNIVHDRRKLFESVPAPAPAAVRYPVEKRVNSVDLATETIVSKMKKKVVPGNQRSTGMSDPVGTSSSNLVNSSREKEGTQILPLEAWCLGHHLFEHSESAPLKLAYEVARQRVTVIRGQSPPKKFEFKVDRDVYSVMIVNDSSAPLKDNVVVQFITTQGHDWKEAERKYTGFKGGGERGKEVLAFLFSTAKDRGFTATRYQTFVTGIRKAFLASAVETIGPIKGGCIWECASRHAAMFERTESRKGKGDHNEIIVDEPSVLARSVTPASSTSVKARTSCPESKPLNGDSGPYMSHRRSARQSTIWSSRTSPPSLLPAQLEPDEVVLMYPPTGTGALSIMQSDLRRLQPEEYLNDTLIEFGLKLWLNDLRGKNPMLADQIHVFSSFFYKKLNNRKKFVEVLHVVCHSLVAYPIRSPEDGYKSVRKWTSKIDLFAKKYVIVPINENVHWYLAIICGPGYTLAPPLPPSTFSNARMTRKRKQKQERAEVNVETAGITEVSLERSNPTAQVTIRGPEADTSSKDATRVTTPSSIGNEELDDVATNIFDKSCFDKSCSITVVSEPDSATSSEVQIRDSSPHWELAYPSSDFMDVDADVSAPDADPNPTREIAGVLEPSTSKSASGIPVDQFYGPKPKPGNVKQLVVVVDNEDGSEDQQQEAEVDNMLALTQSSSGDLPPQYVAPSKLKLVSSLIPGHRLIRTYIFILDSLGTRHPQAIKVLKQYLTSEAQDKRNFDEVRDAVGKQVQVPVQPNTWDCGIYLLHFVKVFMSAPSELLEQILSTRSTMPSSERRKMWQDHEIPQFRDHLKSRIIQLSEEWRAEKTVREEEAGKRGSGDVLEVEALSSEGEVDIVEDIPRVKATPGPRQKQPATRLRG
ncbi:hypothetical protein J3R83DRAFT_13011 [Lanmaoa asiatica]|nr:hypothetical protein J3R83DRAFT_13011 [Lanmaoa asiatica]